VARARRSTQQRGENQQDPARGRLQISPTQDVVSGAEEIGRLVSGEAIAIAFNVRYVLEGLKANGRRRVELRCNAPTTPAVLVR